MTESIATIVRLRWALTFAAMRKSVAQTVGYVITAVIAVSVVIGAAIAGWMAGLLPIGGDAAFLGSFNAAVVFVGSVLVLMIILFQLLYLGQGSTLTPGKFALYGIPDRTLSLGLLLAGLSGMPAIVGVLGMMLWALAYRGLGSAAVIGQIIAAPLFVVVAMSLSKLVVAAVSSLVRSARGKNLFYAIVVLAVILFSQVSGALTARTAIDGSVQTVSVRVESLLVVSDVVSWTPFGAAFQLPFDAFRGDWGPFAARVLILVATVVLCFMGSTACLRHDRLTAGMSAGQSARASAKASAKGLGAFGRMADSPSGAIAARLFTYLKRDARQTMLFGMPILFVVLMGFQSHGVTPVIWMGLAMGSWFMFLGEGNGLAYDGRGYTMEVIAGVSGFTDRKGRVHLLATLATAYILTLALGIFVFTGDWRDGDLVSLDLALVCMALGLSYASLGLAEVLSVVLMYPVPPIDKPFSTPQGRAVAQGFFPFMQLLGTPLTFLPTGLLAIVMGISGTFEASPIWSVRLLGLIALANGVGILALGTWLGGKLLDVRSLSVLKTLNGFASL